MADESQLDQILIALRHEDADVRERAVDRLEGLAASGMTLGGQRRALAAAASDWPDDDAIDQSNVLVTAVLRRPDESCWTLILDEFPRFSAHARWNIQKRLADAGDIQAAKIYVDLVSRYANDDVVRGTPLDGFMESAEATRWLVPALLQHARPDELGFAIRLFALDAVSSGLVSKNDLTPFADLILRTYRPMRERLRALEKPAGDDWIWADEYANDRAHATLLLDLMGHVQSEAILETLEEALTSRDPRVQYFAVIGLLRHQRDVLPQTIEAVAADAETRNVLFDGLATLGQLDRFPTQFASQEALAESDMVNWLTYPTELGRAPHEIELMATFEDEQGEERYYLFRFRTLAPHWAAEDGWVAGLSGPFAVASMPTTTAGGYTFSTFTKWDEATPREHFEAIAELLDRHWNQQAAETEFGEDP